MPILVNQTGKCITKSVANDTIVVATSNAVGEGAVSTLSIRKVIWSGNCQILRNANVVLHLFGNGELDYSDTGGALDHNIISNVVVVIATSASLILHLAKGF